MKISTTGWSAAALICAIMFASGASAQVRYDMSKATCSDYEAMAPGAKRDFAAWMSGWFNGKAGRTEINLQVYHANITTMQQWCASNRSAPVMSLIEAASRNAKPSQGGPASIDVAAISCGDFLGTDPEAQLIVTAWTAGYAAANRNAAVIDAKGFAKQEKAVHTACAKNKKQLLLTAVGKNWK
ncbi:MULTISPECIES: HdeA/HdeB family chaperone [unclassified Bosea (in: a-proteobacteria)]|uniref:HdeA/HdeB family chaperone n=1 Tax=unclassified Bosea (in: a-proteobacteria) TaxID=2653178 RepID=UPI000954A370|nr:MULTISPECIES: HdeA/HdeB family chaperone [unclassified Bosea (in: a-proteobacteria)]TAJ31930.1 MAG: hypothetical protein EPO59_06545 [Bosea sp. (in: a-proteobacteria)]SIR11953.1 HdeA/HdeB family protein [Bosea sp. TND4EK4]